VATELEKKKGGPYTKNEQEQRRKSVRELHFEKGYSAVKISEILGINRNTINEDIKNCYMQMADEIPEQNAFFVLKQIDRLEMQRARLIERLEAETDFVKSISTEKLLFSVDNKICSTFEKMIFNSWDVLGRVRPSSKSDFV